MPNTLQRSTTMALVLLPLSIGAVQAQQVGSDETEVWLSREGSCGEQRSRWSVRQEESGLWVGVIDHTNVGGPCAPGGGERTRTQVHASIAGDTFFAGREAGGTVCTYYGRIREDRVRGIQLCEGAADKGVFALRFPPQGGDSRQVQPGAGQDRFLDDPRSVDPNEVPSGFDLDFRAAPRR